MNTEKPILKELNQRKSIRTFLDREIEKEKLDLLFEAARWAPSSSNKQDWHYYAVMGEARAKFSEILSPGNHWALSAPLILAVVKDGSIDNKVESRDYGNYDVALSVMSLVVEAEHQGLKTHQMAGFNENAFRTILNIPEKEIPVVVVAVGYEEDMSTFPKEVREKETRYPRTRKPTEEVVIIINKL